MINRVSGGGAADALQTTVGHSLFGRGEPHAIEDLSVVFPRVSRARAPLLYRGRFRGSLLPLCAAAAGPYRL
jgi:hypothetical protein